MLRRTAWIINVELIFDTMIKGIYKVNTVEVVLKNTFKIHGATPSMIYSQKKSRKIEKLHESFHWFDEFFRHTTHSQCLFHW